MKKGFTLIELMATVLIIGILAAIALPQYNRAINRARIAEALTNMGNIQRGIDIYRTQYKGDSVNFLQTGGTRMDIDLKGSLTCGSSSCTSKYFIYIASCDASTCTIKISPNTDYRELPRLTAKRTSSGLSASWEKGCQAGQDNSGHNSYDYCEQIIASSDYTSGSVAD